MRPRSSSDEEQDDVVRDSRERSIERPSESGISPNGSCDLRSKLKRKSQAAGSARDSNNTLQTVNKESKAKRVECVQVILARSLSSSDEEEDAVVRDSREHFIERPSESGSSPNGSCDLRSKLKRKAQAAGSARDSNNALRTVIKESKAKRVDNNSIQPHLKARVVDFRDQVNSKSEDVRIKLNRPKRSDLRQRLEETKAKASDGP